MSNAGRNDEHLRTEDTQEQLVIGSCSVFGIGIELAFILLSEAAANQHGRQTAENQRQTPFLWPLPAPHIFLDRWRHYDDVSHSTGRIEHADHFVNHQLSLSTMRGKNVGIPMWREMRQKLAGRMGMGEPAYGKL